MAEIFRYNSQNKSLKEDKDWIVVGRILKTVGLRGFLRISLETDNPERFIEGARLFTRRKAEPPKPCVLAEVREHFTGTKLEVRFEGINGKEEAAEYISALLVIPFGERRVLNNDSYYSDELEGMEVFAPSGEKTGVLRKLESEVPSPYIVIDSIEHGEVLVPFMKKFISEINKEQRRVKLLEPIEYHVPGN